SPYTWPSGPRMSKDSCSSRSRNASASSGGSRDFASRSTSGPSSGTQDSLPGQRPFSGTLPGALAGDFAGHHPAQPQDLGVARVEYRLDDIHGGVDRGLVIG